MVNNYKEKIEALYKRVHEAFILRRQSKNNYEAALSLLEELLLEESDPELQREIFGFRSIFKESIGDYQGSKEDQLKALSLSQKGSYGRYGLELGLGWTSKKLGMYEEAISWYKKALLTSLKSGNTSGAAAIKALLEVKGENELTPQERDLCNQVVKKSWELFQLPGEPDLSNLKEVVKTLIDVGGTMKTGKK